MRIQIITCDRCGEDQKTGNNLQWYNTISIVPIALAVDATNIDFKDPELCYKCRKELFVVLQDFMKED